MIVTINDKRLNLQEGDEVEIEQHPCGRCECDHVEFTVRRGGKIIARLGEYLTLHGVDEVYGGVMVDNDGNILPDYHSVTHIVSNNNMGMTEDRKYWVGKCGQLLGRSPGHEHDRMTFGPLHLTSEDCKRLCPKCLEIHQCEAK